MRSATSLAFCEEASSCAACAGFESSDAHNTAATNNTKAQRIACARELLMKNPPFHLTSKVRRQYGPKRHSHTVVHHGARAGIEFAGPRPAPCRPGHSQVPSPLDSHAMNHRRET